MAFNYSDVQFTDFSGGITDKYIEGLSNEAQVLDNFVLNEVGDPEHRYGFRAMIRSADVSTPTGIFTHDWGESNLANSRTGEDLYIVQNRRVYFFDETEGSSSLKDVRSNPPDGVPNQADEVFTNGDSESLISHSSWNGQLIITNRGDPDTPMTGDLSKPVILYRDENSQRKLVDLGLPAYPIEKHPRYTGDNEISGDATGGTITTIENTLAGYTVDAYKRDYVTIDNGANAGERRRIVSNTINTITVSSNFSVAPTATTKYTIVHDVTDMKVGGTSVIRDEEEELLNNYRYRIHYSYEYTNKTTGKIRFVSFAEQYRVVTDIPIGPDNAPTTEDVNITTSDITSPSITSSMAQLDIANIKTEVYRTENNGTIFYYIGDSVNGSIDDTIIDADLVNNATIYTTASTGRESTNNDIIDFQEVPRCKYLTVVNNTAYYAHCIDPLDKLTEIKSNRFYQSVVGIPSAVQSTSFEDTDDEIVGINNVNGFPIVFTKTFIYRIEGAIDSFGNGTIRKVVISHNAGCVSNNSIVNAGKTLYFAGNDGFYVTDGHSLKNLTRRLPKSYLEIVKNESTTNSGSRGRNIYGTYDSRNEKIYWGVGVIDSANTRMWVFNIDAGGFTTFSGEYGNNPTSFNNTSSSNYLFRVKALVSRGENLYRLDNLGYIFNHSEDYYDDHVRDTSESDLTQWKTKHIPYKLVTVSTDFGNGAMRKWTSSATIAFKSKTKLSYRCFSINDDYTKTAPMTVVSLMNTALWPESTPPITYDFIWGDVNIVWRNKNTLAKQRHMPRKHSRCYRKQIAIVPAESIKFKSDAEIFSNATIAITGTTSTATLTTGKWPLDIANDDIFFSYAGEDYNIGYRITSRISDTEIILPTTSLPTGTPLQWVISGYPKRVRGELKSISVKFSPLSRDGDKFQKQELGGNE